jgi:hypothetical protein
LRAEKVTLSVYRSAVPCFGGEFAAVYADIAQDALVQPGEARHVFTIAKLAPDSVEQDANQHEEFSLGQMHTLRVPIGDSCSVHVSIGLTAPLEMEKQTVSP